MLSCSDPTVFQEWEKAEQDEPIPRKIDGERVVYKSREIDLPKYARAIGGRMISDFGMARIGDEQEGLIQPDVYRAPEVMLCMPWSSATDIWNVGVMVCIRSHSGLFARSSILGTRIKNYFTPEYGLS